jgi:hypothetical protein
MSGILEDVWDDSDDTELSEISPERIMSTTDTRSELSKLSMAVDNNGGDGELAAEGVCE